MNANNSKWVRLTSFSDRFQADLAASILKGSAIQVEIKSDDAGGLFQPLSVASGIDLYVPEDQLLDAKEILQGVTFA